MKRKELTQKQESFALAYIETGNASEAYRRAYDAGRMKPETINKRASELLADGAVTGRIGDLRLAASDKAVVSEARVIEELARIGLFDPGQLFADDGSLLPVKKMPPAVRAAIASVEVDELFDGAGKDRKFIGYTKKIKLWDKNSALEKIMRHLGSFLLDNKQRNPFDGVSRETVKGIVERLEALRGGA